MPFPHPNPNARTRAVQFQRGCSVGLVSGGGFICPVRAVLAKADKSHVDAAEAQESTNKAGQLAAETARPIDPLAAAGQSFLHLQGTIGGDMAKKTNAKLRLIIHPTWCTQLAEVPVRIRHLKRRQWRRIERN